MQESKTVAFVSLGCAKNLVDSEKMLGQLAEAGCIITSDEDEADVVVINTCGFLQASRDEAVAEIKAAVKRKRRGQVGRVVVAGCLVQRDQETLLERVPGIDALVGVNNRDDIVRAVTGRPNNPPLPSRERAGVRVGSSGKTTGMSVHSLPVVRQSVAKADLYLSDYHPFTQMDTARLRITPRHYAYLRISEGCDQRCTFCTIPAIRGPMHSKPPDVIVAEARELASDGAVEISLIGQDTTSYGQDIGYEGGLAGLLRRLNDEVDGVRWIRLMYVYPSVLTDVMIDAVAECDKVCKYIDIPLQHISDHVLKAMHRRITRSETETLLAKLRDRIPGVAIRTTLIAGFPGETEAEFEELVDFIRDFRFDALGVFPYSLEPETPAGRMKQQVPDRIKRQRVERLMTVQQEAAFALAQERVGRRFEVLIDACDAAAGAAVGRHQGQAPSVDSVTIFDDSDLSTQHSALSTFRPGEFVEVRCHGRRDYDLLAAPVQVALPVV